MNNWEQAYIDLFGPLSTAEIPKPDAPVIYLPVQRDMSIAGVAITKHMNNLFATYGEDVVKHELSQIFGLVTAEKV